MANITIYVAPKSVANLRKLRARRKREGSSISKWFEKQVADAGLPRVRVVAGTVSKERS